MFLLDDGWFGNKHPRDADTAGLGDWQGERTQTSAWHRFTWLKKPRLPALNLVFGWSLKW